MRHFFKYIAVFLPCSLNMFPNVEIEIVKVEVATIIWKGQNTSEKFEIVSDNLLVKEALSLEVIDKPKINLDVIENEDEQIILTLNILRNYPNLKKI